MLILYVFMQELMAYILHLTAVNNNLRIQKLLDLHLDRGCLFVGHFPRCLLLWFDARANVKAVLNYVPTDSPKVTCRPGESILIFVQEVKQLFSSSVERVALIVTALSGICLSRGILLTSQPSSKVALSLSHLGSLN